MEQLKCHVVIMMYQTINALRLEQNGQHFADDNLKYICLNENDLIWDKISLEYVPEGFSWQEINIGSGNGLAPNHYLNQCWPRSMMPYGTMD